MSRTQRRLRSTVPDTGVNGVNGLAGKVLNGRKVPKSPSASIAAHKLKELSFQENMEKRQKYLAPSLRAHYANSPSGALKLSSGAGQYLYDENRRAPPAAKPRGVVPKA